MVLFCIKSTTFALNVYILNTVKIDLKCSTLYIYIDLYEQMYSIQQSFPTRVSLQLPWEMSKAGRMLNRIYIHVRTSM